MRYRSQARLIILARLILFRPHLQLGCMGACWFLKDRKKSRMIVLVQLA
jgi:hypothetical protein